MKRSLLAVALLAVGITTASAEWKIAGDKIRTKWALLNASSPLSLNSKLRVTNWPLSLLILTFLVQAKT